MPINTNAKLCFPLLSREHEHDVFVVEERRRDERLDRPKLPRVYHILPHDFELNPV